VQTRAEPHNNLAEGRAACVGSVSSNLPQPTKMGQVERADKLIPPTPLTPKKLIYTQGYAMADAISTKTAYTSVRRNTNITDQGNATAQHWTGSMEEQTMTVSGCSVR